MTRRHFDPRAYQPLGIDHIVQHPRCALWAGMGLGKGVMTYTALSNLEITDDVFPALALGPKRVARDVWPTECEKWEHLKHLHCVSLVGDVDHRNRAVRYDSPVYSINYENVPWLVEYWGDAWPYKTVIADEAVKLKGYRGSVQEKPKKDGTESVRNGGSMRARALAKVSRYQSKRFIELSGAPAPNGYQDLWGQMWFLDGGQRLGRTFTGYQQRWFTYKTIGEEFRNDKYNRKMVLADGAMQEINDRVKDICMTIDAKDWFDLKDPIVEDVYVDLPPQAMKLYRDMEKNMFAELEGATVEAFGAAAKSQKCLQFANGAVYIDPTEGDDSTRKARDWRVVHDAKMEALDSIIEEAGGAAVMVAYTFRSDLARLKKAYPRAVDLSTTAGLAQFKAGDAEIGLCHPASLGHGVDGLQDVCNIIVHFGQDWSLDTYDQLNARIGPVRQMQAGNDRPVFVYHILARKTLDEEVCERRVSKRDIQDILLDAAKRRKYT